MLFIVGSFYIFRALPISLFCSYVPLFEDSANSLFLHLLHFACFDQQLVKFAEFLQSLYSGFDSVFFACDFEKNLAFALFCIKF